MQTVNDLFRQSKHDWVEDARDAARKIGLTKETFTIEDVLLVCPLPKYLHRNTIGSVFKHTDFKATGYVPSRRKISHGRVVREWTLNRELPRNWRAWSQREGE